MPKDKQEKIGEAFVMLETMLYALFPIIITHSTKLMPPILFAGMSILLAALPLFLYLLVRGSLQEVLHKKALPYILLVTLFIIVIPSILIFTGTSKSSGINTSILLQSEILFTLVICHIFTKEVIGKRQVFGGLILVTGTILILYNGSFKINPGELLIILGTLFYPIGNIYAKKALQLVSPATILFIRSLLGGTFLIGLSLLIENHSVSISDYAIDNWQLIILNGFLIYCISKLVWYEAFKRIDINKAILIGVGGAPAISLFYAFIFLHEIASVYQWAGLIITVTGVLLVIKQRKAQVLN